MRSRFLKVNFESGSKGDWIFGLRRDKNKETSQFYQFIYSDRTDLFVINKYGFFQILFYHLEERTYIQYPKNIPHQGHYTFPSTY